MDTPLVTGIVSSREQVSEGQLLKIKASQPSQDFSQNYYQLEVAPDQPLLLVARQNYQNGTISAIIPPQPPVYPGSEVRFYPREKFRGIIQGPILGAFQVGDSGCTLQIANWGDIPPHFAKRRFEAEIQTLQGTRRVPVVKQNFQYSYSDTELLVAVLDPDYRPEDFPSGSWTRFHD